MPKSESIKLPPIPTTHSPPPPNHPPLAIPKPSSAVPPPSPVACECEHLTSRELPPPPVTSRELPLVSASHHRELPLVSALCQSQSMQSLCLPPSPSLSQSIVKLLLRDYDYQTVIRDL
ncbi:hypothetical protein PIB30_009411 [Stylosanthes scabra]|uniref:Uncharacterized protein n=1 Tax=Stylosanthes scabra TaxID=79078 RepID=A0ABU6W5T7_9FABA|nr:hypothetical protein [Stylosanthes scabra]